MTLGDRVKQFFGRANNPRMMTVGPRSEPPVRGTEQFLQTYDSSPWVRAVAGRVSQSIGETKWTLGRNDRADRPVPSNHILLRTLRRPNPLMSGTSLIRVSQLSLDLVGDAFWLYGRNGLAAPTQFWPVPPHWVAELPTSAKPYYDIVWQSWWAKIPESEMLWIHEASPTNPYARGHGIVQALADEISGDECAAKHTNQLFFNRATPEFVVMDAAANADELRVHERAWLQRLQGLFKQMKPYFTNRDLKFWQPQTMNLENLTLVPLRKWERDIQLGCWGIPPEQLGLVENSNRATIEASDYIFESRLVRPRRQFLAEELSLKLAPLYDERLEVSFVDTTPRNKDFELSAVKAYPAAFKVNDVRELVGREPWPGPEGDAKLIPLNVYATTDLLDQEQRPRAGAAPTPTPTMGEENMDMEEPKDEGKSAELDPALPALTAERLFASVNGKKPLLSADEAREMINAAGGSLIGSAPEPSPWGAQEELSLEKAKAKVKKVIRDEAGRIVEIRDA